MEEGEKEEEDETSVSVSYLLKNFECGICLETLDIPRRLDCDHYFCKHCLDNLLKFNKRGICTIKCPNQCAKITTLTKDKTTLHLGTDYMMRGILDMVVHEDQTKTAPRGRECEKNECVRESSKYCYGCNATFCSTCDCPCSNDYFSIMSDRNGKLAVLCELHTSVAKWVCVHEDKGQGIFVCVYCVNRNHRNHKVQTITKYARGCRSKLSTEMGKVVKMQNELAALQEATQLEMSGARERLETILKYRKLSCLNQYMQLLGQEEENLLTQFDQHVRHHNKQYQFGYSEVMAVYKDIVSKSNLMFVMNLARYVQPERPTITDSVVALSGYDFMSTSPLGEMECIDDDDDDDDNDVTDDVIGGKYDVDDVSETSTSMKFQIGEVDDNAVSSATNVFGECLLKMFPNVVNECIEDKVEDLLSQRFTEREEQWIHRLRETEETLETAQSNEAHALQRLESQSAAGKASEAEWSGKLEKMKGKFESAEVAKAESVKRLKEVESKLKLAEAKIFQLWSNMTLQKEEFEVDVVGYSWGDIHDGYYTRLLNRERSRSQAEANDILSQNRLKTMIERAETAEARAAGYYKRLMEREASLKRAEYYGTHLISRVKDLERELFAERSYKSQIAAVYCSQQLDLSSNIEDLREAKRRICIMEAVLLMVFFQCGYWLYQWVRKFFI